MSGEVSKIERMRNLMYKPLQLDVLKELCKGFAIAVRKTDATDGKYTMMEFIELEDEQLVLWEEHMLNKLSISNYLEVYECR
ncbi:MAG: hypothetical protein IJE43_02330 [Alphaproteobacteria bacterium]|nr:hypothetical protein [Alphaproteobacteria bacterium]